MCVVANRRQLAGRLVPLPVGYYPQNVFASPYVGHSREKCFFLIGTANKFMTFLTSKISSADARMDSFAANQPSPDLLNKEKKCAANGYG
jgi:hypothetical protein